MLFPQLRRARSMGEKLNSLGPLARPAGGRYTAFLSSIYGGPTDELGVRALRTRIWEVGRRLRPIWVAEHSDPGLEGRAALDIVDECLDQVGRADIFLCVLHGKHGSRIRSDKLQASWNASHFEVEIYQAALLRKPIYVLVHRDFDPDSSLMGFLSLLGDVLPHAPWPRLSDDQIVAAIEQIVMPGIARSIRHRYLSKLSSTSARLTDALAAARDDAPAADLRQPSFEFLGGNTDTTIPIPDLALVRDALQRADTQTNQQRRLARYWIALRGLMGAHYRATRDPEVLRLWDRALGGWGKSAAWYGLHAHLRVGTLAAFGSQWRARIALADAGAKDLDPGFLKPPHGPLGSAYYSLSKRHRSPQRRARALTAGLSHVNAALVAESGDPSGLYAIRASIHLAQGNRAGAIEDYRRVYDIRRSAAVSAAGIGEALSEFGFGLVQTGRRREGLGYLEEGVDLLQQHGSPGFLVRAKRKLAVGYAKNGSLVRARAQLLEAHDLAVLHGLHDQITAEMKLVRRLSL